VEVNPRTFTYDLNGNQQAGQTVPTTVTESLDGMKKTV